MKVVNCSQRPTKVEGNMDKSFFKVKPCFVGSVNLQEVEENVFNKKYYTNERVPESERKTIGRIWKDNFLLSGFISKKGKAEYSTGIYLFYILYYLKHFSYTPVKHMFYMFKDVLIYCHEKRVS